MQQKDLHHVAAMNATQFPFIPFFGVDIAVDPLHLNVGSVSGILSVNRSVFFKIFCGGIFKDHFKVNQTLFCSLLDVLLETSFCGQYQDL